jgi:hypothetical protein
MWRPVFVLYLLLSSATFAGESRGQLQVGITITGKGNASAVSPKTGPGAIAEPEISVPGPTEKPAAVGPRDTAPSTR